MLLYIKDAKIPFYDKLPKDNQFYKHFMQSMSFNRMRDAALAKVNEDRQLFEGAVEKLQADVNRAKLQDSPVGNSFHPKRVPFD